MNNLEAEITEYKRKRGEYRQKHIIMLKTAQFLNDKAHYKYYDMCMTYRNNLIKEYKEEVEKEKEALINQDQEIDSVAEPAVVATNPEKSLKKERTKSTRSSKSGSKSRPNSMKKRG
ncbi:unnamed protein product [Heterobilharzia americana]|nr:unnamed protein product [Heterobilharzia americana]